MPHYVPITRLGSPTRKYDSSYDKNVVNRGDRTGLSSKILPPSFNKVDE